MALRKITVNATQTAVEYVDGSFTRVLLPGRHPRPKRATYTWVDMPSRLSPVAPQEILTGDGVTVRVTTAIQWRVADPRLFVEAFHDPFDLVYLASQVALREAAAALDADVLARRQDLGDLAAVVRDVAGDVGIEVQQIIVKDVILPADLRAAYAELVTARIRGEAQLASARAEIATLRSMANGAKLLDDHPALARMRLVQSLPPGATVEIVAPH